MACTFSIYNGTLDKIIELTIRQMPVDKPIIAKSDNYTTSTNQAIDVLLKYCSFLQCQFGSSQDTTYTKSGAKYTSSFDPLLYLINYDTHNSHWSILQNKLPSEIIKIKYYWPEFIYANILEHLLTNNATKILKKDLNHLLLKFFKCREDIVQATEDLYNVLISVTPGNLKGTSCTINPSVYQLHYDYNAEMCQADLIIDKTIIDIKSTNKLKFSKDYLRQLLFYYFWLTFETSDLVRSSSSGRRLSFHSTATEIEKLGIFYSRFDYLFTFSVSELFGNSNKLTKAKNIFFKEVISVKNKI